MIPAAMLILFCYAILIRNGYEVVIDDLMKVQPYCEVAKVVEFAHCTTAL